MCGVDEGSLSHRHDAQVLLDMSLSTGFSALSLEGSAVDRGAGGQTHHFH